MSATPLTMRRRVAAHHEGVLVSKGNPDPHLVGEVAGAGRWDPRQHRGSHPAESIEHLSQGHKHAVSVESAGRILHYQMRQVHARHVQFQAGMQYAYHENKRRSVPAPFILVSNAASEGCR